jgi:hypothetical protein
MGIFFAGVIAKLVTPDSNEPSGFILTTALGIVSALVASWSGQALRWYGPGEGAGATEAPGDSNIEWPPPSQEENLRHVAVLEQFRVGTCAPTTPNLLLRKRRRATHLCEAAIVGEHCWP